jgi:hypothetical protein
VAVDNDDMEHLMLQEEDASRSRMEYATQFFGFPPDSLVDAILADVKDAVRDNVEVQEYS